MELLIRKAKNEDALNLAALSIQVWLHTYATEGIRNSLSEYVFTEYTKERFEGIIADSNRILLVAETDNHLVGFATVCLNSPCNDVPGVTTELATLYVQEHFHQMGIGTKLLIACREQAQLRTGNPEFWLSVYFQNLRAIQFYKKHGFSKRGSFFFEFGGERHENYVLA